MSIDKEKLIKTMRGTMDFQSYRITQLTEEGWKKDDQIRDLKAEVERLRKIAQDIYVTSESLLDSDDKDFIFQWGEYKEGKQP